MGRKSRLRAQEKTTERVAAIQTTTPPQQDRKTLLIACALLLVAIAIVFGRVQSQEFINFDDPAYVTGNENVKKGVTGESIAWAFTAFHSSNWHPLTWISHMIDVQLFGMNAGAHKLVNVAFHAAAAIFLLLFLVRATGEPWPSLIVAALFALHPTRVESVAWVSERKDVLSALFFMLTLFLYAGYVQSGRKTRMIGVTIAFAAALMAKPTAITLPFVLLLLDWWPFRRFEKTRIAQLILEKLPLFALVIGSMILTLRAQTAAITTQLSVGDRLTNAIVSYADYLRMLVWPSGLAILYPYRRAIAPLTVLFAIVVLITITVLALRYARRAPFVIVGWLWFLGTLVPMSGLVQVGRQSMADRYTYLSYVGLFIALVWLAAQTPQLKRALPAIAIAVVLTFSVLTFVQAGYWKNSETLFTRALAVTSNNEIAELNLGAALIDRGAAQEGLAHIRAGVEADPNNAVGQNHLGRALAAIGDHAGAEHALQQAIRLDPNLTDAYRNLADVKLKMGQQEEAAALLAKANVVLSDAATRAELAATRGDIDTALREYDAAVRESPDNAAIRNGYAAMLARKGRDADALGQYREALRLRPEHYDANMNVGALLSRMGRDAEAAEHFERAAASRPSSPEPHIYLALIYGNRGDAAKAVEEVEKAGNIDQVEANRLFTNAVQIPFKETNLADYRAALKAQLGGR